MKKRYVYALAAVLAALLLSGCDGSDRLTFTGGGQGYSVGLSPTGDPRLTNGFDGYAITLPAGAEVDTRLASVRTAVAYGDVRLYIYAEDAAADGQDSYINYSNTFLSNDWGTELTASGSTDIGGCDAVYNAWKRQPLTKVEGDLPNYACFDIKHGSGRTYTLMFKYADGVDYDKNILPVARSFKAARITAAAPELRVGGGEGPKMNAQTARVYDSIFGPNAGLTWGIFMPYMNEPEKTAALQAAVDYDFDIYLMYTGFMQTDGGEPAIYGQSLYDFLNAACPPGKLPELTLQTSPTERGLMIYDVLCGEHDGFLHDYAAAVAAYGRPLLMRLGNEMNGDWCSYSGFTTCRDPDIFVEFYRYVFDIFQEEGADNAIWVFNPNGRSYPDFKWNHELLYYPGDEYVNVVGMTAYNTGTYYDFEKWSTFDELYSDLYAAYVGRYDRPLMITEFACSGVGGDKAAWIDDMFGALPSYPEIKAAVWWNSCDLDADDPTKISRPYMLDETAETTEAFKRGLAAYK